MNGQSDGICYLCGRSLDDASVNQDHLPPKQFFPAALRKARNLNLLTVPTHKSCNRSYQLDEDYFVQSLVPLAAETPAGSEISQAFVKQLEHKEPDRRARAGRLGRKILAEFEHEPGGIVLPHGRVAKRFDRSRVWRVIWKITRGLFHHEIGGFLPEEKKRVHKILTLDDEPPPEFVQVSCAESRGRYPDIFDYKYVSVPELNDFQYWALLLWQQIVFVSAFHRPGCPCDDCQAETTLSS